MIFLDTISFLAFSLGVLMVLYQIIYLIVGVVGKTVVFSDAEPKKYAVIVSARNESQVISTFIKSVREQDYPADKLDIWIIADNCTDNTAELSRSLGAKVIERNNLNLIGKGYALTYFFDHLFKENLVKNYDAFFIFDADNTLNENYFTEMNKAFCHGYDLVTSYRNSRNFSSNWVSAGSALWFIRESRFINNSRQIIGINSHVGGTGFMFARHVLQENEGWKFHLLTEDLQFTMDSIIRGYKIGYCGTAMFYDEQPTTFRQSWRQRLRWSKGFLQVFRHYGVGLVQASAKAKNFSYFDFTIMVFPWMVVSVIRILLGVLFATCGLTSWYAQVDYMGAILFGNLVSTIVMTFFATVTVMIERKNIGASNLELFAYCLTFPIFILSYIPISFVALFSKVEWKPIEHKGITTGNK